MSSVLSGIEPDDRARRSSAAPTTSPPRRWIAILGRHRRLRAWPACLVLLCPVADASQAAEVPRPATMSLSVRVPQERCFVDTVPVTGTLVPRDLVDIVPTDDLKVAEIRVAPLDVVTAGQALARLVSPDGATSVTLRAPVPGVVLRSLGAVGQSASPRRGPLFQMMADGAIELAAEAPLGDLDRIKPAQSATVHPLGGAELAGRVRRVDADADATSQVGRVRIGLASEPGLRVGTFARGVIAVGRRCGLGVPQSAVQFEAGATYVQIVEGGRVEPRAVSIGLTDRGEVEVRSGLTGTDLVVVRAAPFVREGDWVESVKMR